MHIQPLEPRRMMDAADLDPSFGDGGGVLFDVGPEALASATAVQPDGKIVVAGRQGSNAFLARFNADGSRDATFGVDGVTKLNLGFNESFGDIAVVKGGRILASGAVVAGVSRYKAILVRYRADGTIDSGNEFGGGDGIHHFSGRISGMTVAGGKIFTFGEQDGTSVVRRHNFSTGRLDTGFSGDGLVDVDAAVPALDEFSASDAAVSQTGAIAVIGSGSSDDPTENTFPFRNSAPAAAGGCLVLLDADGDVNAGFDENGVLFVGTSESPRGVFGADGTLYVAGVGNFETETPSGNLYRIAPDGTHTVTGSPQAGPVLGVGLTATGDPMFGGQTYAARFNPDGTIDRDFSTDGYIDAPPHPEFEALRQVYGPFLGTGGSASVLPDGSIVLAQHFERFASIQDPQASYGPIVLTKLRANAPSLDIDVRLESGGVLLIEGSAGNDSVGFDREADIGRLRVFINGQQFAFALDDVTRISATLGGGSDEFNASGSGTGTIGQIPLFVDGEAGNDLLIGGPGADTLIGGLDDDTVAGGFGDDSVYGNGGKDTLLGEQGSDRVDGGSGRDSLRGGSGGDRLFGGANPDHLFGDGGHDRFFANDGASDYVAGGDGDDRADVDLTDELDSIVGELT
jgi:uncharacterized delta-60 repeat protein